MSETVIIALISAVLGGGLVGAVREWLKDRKRAPIDAATANVAMSQTVAQAAVAMSQETQAQLMDVRREVEASQQMIAVLRADMEKHRRLWQTWYDRISRDWETVRQQPVPPDPPGAHGGRSFSSMIEP